MSNINSRKGLGKIKEFLSWVIAVGGLTTSIFWLANDSGFTKGVVYLIIIIDSLVLIGLGIYAAITYYMNKTAVEEKEREVLNGRHEIEKLTVSYSGQKKAYLSLSANCNYMVSTLQLFLNRLYDLTLQSLDGTEAIQKEEIDMQKHGYDKHEIELKTITMAKEKDDKISKELYDDYKRFLSNILSKTQNNIENYLKTKGYDFEVSIAIKQLIKPALLTEQEKYTSQPYVYTAFRDSRTWLNKKRKEVAQRKYTINKNSDFIHCLSQGYYIFNNKTRDSRDYCNENTEFDLSYNCGTTTLISSPKEDSDKYIYGFLACDVLNNKYGEAMIMDVEIANFLETAAHIISVYFDNIDFNWVFCQISERYNTFWQMVYG